MINERVKYNIKVIAPDGEHTIAKGQKYEKARATAKEWLGDKATWADGFTAISKYGDKLHITPQTWWELEWLDDRQYRGRNAQELLENIIQQDPWIETESVIEYMAQVASRVQGVMGGKLEYNTPTEFLEALENVGLITVKEVNKCE